MKHLRNLVLLILIFFTASCGDQGGDCLSGSGTIIFQERQVADFDTINMKGYLNMTITQDCVNSVTVEAGEKIIDGLITEVRDSTLFIDNLNTCNWTRDYGKPLNVHVRVRRLSKIDYESSGNITSVDTLCGYRLIVDVHDGCGTIRLILKNEYATLIERMGTVDYHVSGKVIFGDIYSAGYGPFHCTDLQANYMFVTSLGSNDCYVRAKNCLDATIKSIGNVYYTGTPDSIAQKLYSTGKLIPL